MINMCAISGIYKTQNQSVTLNELQSLAITLQHRGPNGEGHHLEDSVGLYHQRLAIHDLSVDGMQPFSTSNHTHAIVNGEIYNYLELKAQLTQSDCDLHWHSTSDCEVIPYLFEKYQADFVEHLRGMYALAVYDAPQKELWLSRDPFGMKQLYYYQDESGFYFASELRALQHFLNLRHTDKAVLKQLLQLHFATGNSTAIATIKRVLPGETLFVKDGKITARNYYPSKLGLIPQKKSPARRSRLTPLQQFDALFEETVALHLQSDVPVGLFLSGGVDSTCILTMAQRLIKQPIHTYTLGFKSSDTQDERCVAAQVAAHFATKHHEIEFTEEDFWELLPEAIRATDDPTADYAIVPTFKLAQMAAKDVTVVLSGEGGDELFAGYGRYRSYIRPVWKKRRNFYYKGDLSRLNLLKSDNNLWRQHIQEIEKACRTQGYDRLYTAQTIDMQTWLPNDLLIKLDRCLMWHSLEGRTPFLDKLLAEFALTLPNKLKIKGKQGKWILRSWLNQHLKQYDAFSPKKGFTVPLQSWLENRRDWLQNYLPSQSIITELCDIAKVNAMLAKPLTKTTTKATWSLMYLALWHQIHISRER